MKRVILFFALALSGLGLANASGQATRRKTNNY